MNSIFCYKEKTERFANAYTHSHSIVVLLTTQPHSHRMPTD